ncbi:LacI family DNA-binding transcriptional regulator [Paracoccus aerodenitrificans]|uniref:LacI family DNA-binding transcriptional regulator n=1 Tax=Paracoccus aerodenitrificans TaxID=3017781 RepID=UPI0022F09F12|nr:LacI family DNA-binding transcriptional regulator [Paracoccus aerodenitrificans]WBU63507.1 LacI family DNA-binding transcriptional regulator [Paracoccus aerodenitrificans]
MKDQSRAPRIHDVARLAGVSSATVSRALSKPDMVSEATRQAVAEAVRETGYIVNVTARNLRQQQVGGVLALVPNLANPFFSEILSGIASTLRARGLNLLVLDTRAANDGAPAATMASYLNRARCDGVIVMDGAVPAEMLSAPSCPPVVQVCEWTRGLNAPRILADNAGGACEAARHLTELGHRRILHLRGPSGNTLTTSRQSGFVEGVNRAGIDIDRDVTRIDGDFSLRSGFETAARLARMQPRPSAVFCDNDEMAIGLIHGLHQLGLRVPDDISVVGFDNIEMARYSLPPLTTIRQWRTTLGRRAAETLLASIEGETVEDVVILPVELILRDSTASV